ncbi:MAG: PIN domain-containing protein [Desulfohalobiaceae bacterium]|nr:PIN domain-containing protein [Desulfohalobiaceae bacterium]
MILLDTNVLSELMRPAPHAGVVHWLDRRSALEIWICSITVAEIRLGLTLMPQGHRRQALFALAEQTFQEEFSDRLLATRNTKYFSGIDGLQLVNPWDE